MMTWTFKTFDELSTQELYGLLRLRNEVFILEQNCPYQDLDNKDFDAIHLLGRDETNQILAYCRIMPKPVYFKDYTCIGRVVTSMKIRRTGVGYELMELALNYAKSHYPKDAIKISGQAYLRQFYESLGFKVLSEETYLEDNIPHYGMVYEVI